MQQFKQNIIEWLQPKQNKATAILIVSLLLCTIGVNLLWKTQQQSPNDVLKQMEIPFEDATDIKQKPLKDVKVTTFVYKEREYEIIHRLTDNNETEIIRITEIENAPKPNK